MTNLTIGIYPYFSYIPAAPVAGVFAVLVYLSLISWLVQSLWFSGCRPRIVSILIFLSHFCTFVELILRATITYEERNTKKLYKLTATFLTMSSQTLLGSSFQCLEEMRGGIKARPIDIVAKIIVPIGLIGSAVFLSVAKNYSFDPKRLQLSFYLRQISVGIFFVYVVLFFVFWHINIVNFRRRYIKPLLIITCICLLIDGAYVLATALPSLFSFVSENELWFYLGHLLPILISLLSWSFLFWRKQPSYSEETNDDHKENKKVLLPTSKR